MVPAPPQSCSPGFKPAQEVQHVGVDLVQMPTQCVCIVVEYSQRTVSASGLNALLNDRQFLNITDSVQCPMEDQDRALNLAGSFHG